MTIPKEELVLKVEFKDIPIEYSPAFDRNELEENPLGVVNTMRKFLIKYADNWKRDEINALTFGELGELSGQIGTAISRVAVPLANSPS